MSQPNRSEANTSPDATQAWNRENASPEEPQSEGSTPARGLDDFELLEQLGKGGMGVVYKARQRSLGGEGISLPESSGIPRGW